MRTTPIVRTLTSSSRYVCFSCCLQEAYPLAIRRRIRHYSSAKEEDNSALSASPNNPHETIKPDPSSVTDGPPTVRARKATARKTTDIPSKRSKTTASKKLVEEKVPAAKNRPKQPSKAKARKGAVPFVVTELVQPVAALNNTACPTEPPKKPYKGKTASKHGELDDALASPSTATVRERVRKKKSVASVVVDDSKQGAASSESNDVSSEWISHDAVRTEEVDLCIAENDGSSGNTSPPIRKMRRVGIRKTRPSRLVNFGARVRYHQTRYTRFRKVRPLGLRPRKPSLANHGIATKQIQAAKSKSAQALDIPRTKRRGSRHRPTAAVGISIDDAMKKRSVKPDDELPRLKGNEVDLDVVDVPLPSVPQLAHGLERVLFNPGVHHLRDPRTRTFNFDPHLEKLMPVRDFNFDSLNIFTPPSQDENLARIARNSDKKYLASTSSLTGTLRHFHYLLSQWRPINFNLLSKGFPTSLTSFTRLQRAPEAMFLRWKDGIYAIDSDKYFDSANVLSLMGRYMEKLLTLGKEGFMRHSIGTSNPITHEERTEPEAFHYSTLGDFILRSQLDAHDSRLPGPGIFDLKTRAVVPIRMDSANYEWGTGYEIRSIAGQWQSYEREYHDMLRSTMLKYMLQVRMGRMDGIFVAFHNIARIFGFQYISLEEMDNALHGQWNRTLGDQEFGLSLRLLNEIFNKTTEKFPRESLRFHFETRPSTTGLSYMYVFAEPVTEQRADNIQNANRQKIKRWERSVLQGTSLEPPNMAANDGKESGASTSDGLDKEEVQPNEPTEKEPGKPGSSTERGPLGAYILTITNRVNNKRVKRPRTPMTEKDEWEVAYSLTPVDDPLRAWRLYNMCKVRRYREMSEEAKKQKDNDYFKDMLKRIVADSRRWRARIDKREQLQKEEGRGVKTLWDNASHQIVEDKPVKKQGFLSRLFRR